MENTGLRFYRHILPACTLFFCVLLLFACSSSDTQNQTQTIFGKIQMIGNEPFPKLAIESEGGTTYILQADSSIAGMLMKHQGERAQIEYNGMVDVPEGKALKVVHAVLAK